MEPAATYFRMHHVNEKWEGMVVRKYWFVLLTTAAFALFTGCSFFQPASEAANDEKDLAADDPEESSETASLIKLSAYAEEIGATIDEPNEQLLSVQQSFLLKGHIRDAAELKRTYIWVLMNGPEGGSFDAYLPIEDGHFEQQIQLFEGKGTYTITVRAPDKEKEDHFYDLATFTVKNESADVSRDIAMRPPGLEAGLQLTQPENGYTETDGSLTIEGTINEKYNGTYIMVKEEKDGRTAEMLFPIEDGSFFGVIPLHYGPGIHDIRVLVPDLTQDNHYLDSALMTVDNTSTAMTEPVEYFSHYYEQRFQLNVPLVSGLQAGDQFRVAGSFDPTLESNRQVEQLIVITEKDGEEASYLIPAYNGKFDDEFWLRFGPGEYEVTLNVPTDPGAEQSYFEFAAVAKFKVTSDAEDQRHLMPSRGIQADAPDIGKLAKDLTRGKKNDRDKAKAIYQYVAKTVKYDVEKLQNDAFKLDDSALKTLETERGVCQDYAFLTVALLRSTGIEARYIGGTTRSGPDSPAARHAWVETKVDDEWLVMDPTWGAGYVQDGTFVARYDESYFDPDPEQLSKTHVRDEVIY